MKLQLDNTTPLQFLMYFVIIVQECVSFNVFPFLKPLSLFVQLLSLLIFLYLTVIFLHRPRLSVFDTLVLTYMFLLVIFTVINGTDIKNSIYRSCNVVSLILLIRNYPNHKALMLKSMMLSFSFCIYINMILMILFPNWMVYTTKDSGGFLLGGNYNEMGCRMLPCLVVCTLYSIYNKRWIINTVLVAIICISTLIIVGSMTSATGLCMFLILSLLPFLRMRKLAILGIISAVLLVQFFIVFAGESVKNNDLLVYFIEDVLHKDITFTYRTLMWDAAAKVVAQSPIIGWGYVDTEWFMTNMSSFAIGPHNFIYSILIFGGGILLSLFTGIVLFAAKNIWFNFNKFNSTLLIGISALFTMMLMEMYPFFFVFLLLILANYSLEIEEALKLKKQIVK